MVRRSRGGRVSGSQSGTNGGQSNLVVKYVGAVVLLGLIEGLVTYFYLSTVYCSTLLNNVVNDPISLIPYIFLMAVISVVTLYLLVQNEAFNAMLFIAFIMVWLFTGFGSHYLFVVTSCAY